jgi:hypothetical protein
MRRFRRLACRPDTKVTASGWSLLWQGMGRSLPPELMAVRDRTYRYSSGQGCRRPVPTWRMKWSR